MRRRSTGNVERRKNHPGAKQRSYHHRQNNLNHNNWRKLGPLYTRIVGVGGEGLSYPSLVLHLSPQCGGSCNGNYATVSQTGSQGLAMNLSGASSGTLPYIWKSDTLPNTDLYWDIPE